MSGPMFDSIEQLMIYLGTLDNYTLLWHAEFNYTYSYWWGSNIPGVTMLLASI